MLGLQNSHGKLRETFAEDDDEEEDDDDDWLKWMHAVKVGFDLYSRLINSHPHPPPIPCTCNLKHDSD